MIFYRERGRNPSGDYLLLKKRFLEYMKDFTCALYLTPYAVLFRVFFMQYFPYWDSNVSIYFMKSIGSEKGGDFVKDMRGGTASPAPAMTGS